MRRDLSHVIVERPRLGGHFDRKGRPIPLEDLPKHEAMRRPHARCHNLKEFNENLAPLRRYLEHQVGRPWNKIYSEIAQNLRADSTVQQHVRDHLDDFVAVNPRRLVVGAFYGPGEKTERSECLWYQPLYVDPKDGLLKRTDKLPEEKAWKACRRQQRYRRAAPDRISLASDLELRRIDGLWFEVTLAPLPEPEYRALREVRKVPLKPYARNSPTVEIEITVGRLITNSVKDVIRGVIVPAGPY